MIKNEKVKDIILKILYTIMLIVAFIYIGSPLYNKVIYPIYLIIDIVAIVVIILSKNKIKINRLDIVVTTLCLVPIIPLIFRKYLSLERNSNKYSEIYTYIVMLFPNQTNNPNK